MHHLIYIPREHIHGVATEEQLAAVGLEDHAASAETRPCPTGPDGSGGTLYGWLRPGNPFHFNAAEQTWFPAAAAGALAKGRYWVGIYNASPPCETDLRRPYRFGGRVVRLAGQDWLIPTPTELPHDAKLADDGTWRFVIQRRFHDYFLRTQELVDQTASEAGLALTLLDMLQLSLEALGLNYRLPPELASHLSLFDQVTAAKTFSTALGLDLRG